MAQFRYIVERGGEFFANTVESPNRREAEAVVQKANGRPAAYIQELDVELPDVAKHRMSLFHQVSMWRILAASAKGGLTAMQALDVAAKTMPVPKHQATLRWVYDACVTGLGMTAAFTSVPNICDHVALGMIGAGETSGSAQKSFEQVRQHVESRYAIRRAIMSALVYPFIVLPIAGGLIFFLLGWVLPTFDEIYKELGTPLPAPTRILMATGTWVKTNKTLAIGIAGGLLALLYSIPILATRPFLFAPGEGERKIRWPSLHRLMLKIPLFGPIFRLSLEASMVRTLVTLAKAGLELPLRLRLCRTLTWNLEFSAALSRIYEFVVGGRGPMSTALRAEPHLFTALFMGIAQASEVAPDPDSQLEPYAQTVEEMVHDRVKALEKTMEPLMIVGLAAIVLPIVLAVFLPLVDMVQNIK